MTKLTITFIEDRPQSIRIGIADEGFKATEIEIDQKERFKAFINAIIEKLGAVSDEQCDCPDCAASRASKN